MCDAGKVMRHVRKVHRPGAPGLMLGLVRQDEGPAADALRELGADLNTVRAQVIRLRPGTSEVVKVASTPGAPDKPLRAQVDALLADAESLQQENGRLRAILRHHNINPDEDTGPGGDSGPAPTA
jgi:hypothetical protein